jgi:hypothetical protein
MQHGSSLIGLALISWCSFGLMACGGDDAKPNSDGGGASAGSGATSGSGGDTSGGGTSSSNDAGSPGEAGTGTDLTAPEEHSYAADDPRIQYMGRMDWSDPQAPRFAASAAQLRIKFSGTGASVRILDENRYGTNKNYFEVLVDDEPALKLQALKTQTSYQVAEGLPNGEHTLTIAKRTEAAVGYSSFLGLTIQGELLEPEPLPERRLEIIGDSISCGSGNEAADGSPECSEDGWGQPYHNGYLAYGPVMARALDAQYHVTAVSGIGLVRNYSSMYDARPMPEVYDLMFPQEMTSAAWDTTQFVPDAVIVTLGTNDFSPGDSAREKMTVETYTAAYIDFVTTLRGYYPDAHIFGVSSPMLGDGWPEPTDMSATDLRSAITAMVEHFNGAGDDKVHQFNVTKLIGTGCGTHPSAEQDASMAAELGEFVKTTLGW